MKKAKKVLKIFLIFFILISSSLACLCFSPLGTALINLGSGLFGNYLSYEKIDGVLAGKFSISKLSIRLEPVDIEAARIDFSWKPDRLLKKSLSIGELAVKGVNITFKPQAEQQKSPAKPEDITLPEVLLPFAVMIGRLSIEDLTFADQDEEWWKINKIELSLQSDGAKYKIKKLIFDSPEAGFDLIGSLTMQGDWPMEAAGKWRLDFTGYNQMAGELGAKGNMERLAVELAARRPVALAVSGVLENILQDASWQAAVKHGAGSLMQINQSWPDILLEDLTAEAKGTWFTYGGVVSGHASYWYIDKLWLDISLDGDYEGIRFHRIDAKYRQGEALGKGEIGWADHFFWRGEADFNGVSPSDYQALLPGSLDGKLLTEGKIGYGEHDILHCFFKVPSLTGLLQGYPVKGAGVFRIDGDELGFEKIALQSGGSTIQVDGKWGRMPNFSLALDSPDIGHFLPEAGGSLTGSGKVGAKDGVSVIEYQFAGENIQYAGARIGGLDGTGNLDLAPDGRLKANLTARDLLLGGSSVSKIALIADGSTLNHQVSLDFQAGAGSADGEINLSGRLADDKWTAEINRMLLNLPVYGRWRSQQSIQQGRIMVDAAGNAAAENIGLGNSYGEINASFAWQGEGGWSARLSSAGFDLAYLKSIFDTELDYQARAFLQAEAAGDISGIERAALDLSLKDAKVSFPFDGENRQLRWQANSLSGSLKDRQLELNLSSRLEDGSFIEGQVQGSDFGGFSSDYAHKKISGNVELWVDKIENFSFLTKNQVKPEGTVSGQAAFGGSIAEPYLHGDVNLQEADLFIPAAGISLEDSRLRIKADNGKAACSFTAKSGTGTLTGKGMLSYQMESSLFGVLTISGKEFTAVSLPEYKASVSPDIQFNFDRDISRLTGDIVVDNAVIAPHRINTVLTESSDVVYVDETEEDQGFSLPLLTKLNIRLGEQVLVDTFGLKGNLTGGVTVSGKPDKPFTADGRLTLQNGIFSIYGRDLELARGQVLFTGGPIENPNIDVRIQKTVDAVRAGSGESTVGLDVSGQVDDLQFELFSDPPMDQTDILAYMIVDHPSASFDEEEEGLIKTVARNLGLGATADLVQGIGSVLPVNDMHMEGSSDTEDTSIVVGRSLTDRLYFGYDYNFFESSSELVLRYDLGRGFYLESRSSVEASGGDIFYSFER